MRTLLLDIETAPNLATVWGLWNQNISLNQLLTAGYTLCWSAKWLGEENIFFDSIYRNESKTMLTNIHNLLDEADAVIHFNGTKFDIPTLNKEFLLHKMNPPAPYKQIDLLKVARSQFKFPSNKLDYIAQALGLGKKTKHRGHQLWIDCMNRKADAWKEMEEYNINDVILLENVYYKLRPWTKNHPNYALYGGSVVSCPTCGSDKHHRRGYYYTKSLRYQRHVCLTCGSWFRDRKSVDTDAKQQFVGI